MRPAHTVLPLFETPLYASDEGFETLGPRLVRWTRALVREDPRGTRRSNTSGWHSKGNLLDRPEPIVREAEAALRAHVDAFLGRLSSRRARRYDFDLYAWINVNRRGASNARHVHPNSFLSGACYLKVPKRMRSGHFVVWDPRGPMAVMYGAYFQKFDLPWKQQWRIVEVRAGRTLLFPAWLEHEVTPLEEDVERISLAFNVYRAGQAPI